MIFRKSCRKGPTPSAKVPARSTAAVEACGPGQIALQDGDDVRWFAVLKDDRARGDARREAHVVGERDQAVG